MCDIEKDVKLKKSVFTFFLELHVGFYDFVVVRWVYFRIILKIFA